MEKDFSLKVFDSC